MGGGLEVDLSHGAVAKLWTSVAAAEAGWRPVLQVADVRHLADGCFNPATELRYRVVLSDGVHSQPGTLAASLSHHVRDGALRRGSVIRVLDFVRDSIENHCRTIFVIRLEILQSGCALIGNLKLYEPVRKSVRFASTSTTYAYRPNYEPYVGGQHIRRSCIVFEAENGANNLSCYGPCGGYHPASERTLSSIPLLAEPDVWKMVGQIKDEKLVYSNKPAFITVKAIVSYIDTESFCYAACPLVVNGKRCNVKVAGNNDGTWLCKRCHQSFESCDYGYWVHIQIQDCTGTASAFVCQEACNQMFGCTAEELDSMKHDLQDYAQFGDIIHEVLCHEYVFKLKVKVKPSSGRYHADCTVLKAENVNPSAESHRLLRTSDTILEQGSVSCLEFSDSI